MASTTAVPETATPRFDTSGSDHADHAKLYHVILLDDNEHTYDYVVEMLGAIFFMPPEVAFRHAEEVDATGRTIVMTCEKDQAEFGKQQVESYGADPRMPKSKGSMSARVEPAR